MGPSYLSAEKEKAFPKLQRPDYQVTSDEDWVYNCIAHAADKDDCWWWPTTEEAEGVFWPQGVPIEETLEAFVAAFGTAGYVPCDSSDSGKGFEKVAIFVDADGKPTHAAKQLPSGRWTSKLGRWEDIEHNSLDSVSCHTYGNPVSFLKRDISEPAHPNGLRG